MKKLLILTAVGAILTAPAIAVQKCVYLDTTDRDLSEGAVDAPTYQTEWAAKLEGKTIRGIARCLPQSFNFTETKASLSIPASFDVSDHRACHCRMILPAVSNWVVASDIGDYEDCIQNCPRICAIYLQGKPAFRQLLFSTVRD